VSTLQRQAGPALQGKASNQEVAQESELQKRAHFAFATNGKPERGGCCDETENQDLQGVNKPQA